MPFAAFRTPVIADVDGRKPAALRPAHARAENFGIHEFTDGDQKYLLSIASAEEHFHAASRLIQDMYSWRGYGASSTIDRGRNRTTLLAWRGDHVVGTLTLGLDSAEGLIVDELYKDQTDRLRAEGRRICELTQFAVDNAAKSWRLLAVLFHLGYIFAYRLHACTDSLIEINPRHVDFYSRMLGFRLQGSLRNCARVNAPARLMRLELASAHRRVRVLGGQNHRDGAEMGLYRHALSPFEEDAITRRLLAGI